MNENLNLALLVLILQLSISYTFTNAEPLYVSCSDDTNASNYAANGTFEDNLKFILDSLPSSTSHTGFNNTLIGEIPDQVYGQGLCRGDVNSTVCYNCIRKATKEIVRDCDSKQAMIWYDLCQVHYSFQNFFSKNTFTGKFPQCNNQKKSMPNSVHFNHLLNYLLYNLKMEASSDTSTRMFAVGEIKVSKSTNLYGLVQCTPDIQSSECNNCLSSAFTELEGCCHAREGGMVLGRNCNIRYELRRFYDASSILLTYPSSKESKWNTGTIVGIICITAFFLTAVIASLVVYFKHKKGALEERSEQALIQELSRPTSVTLTEEGFLVSSQDFAFLHLPILRAATKDFSDSKKLGRGGFGTVYKGVMPNGKEIAVKRLSKKSWQGLEELKNEIILIAKLQHRNLVRLLGCGIEGDEKLLIYEFMPNQSLDLLIFDSKRRSVLDWKICFDIICGIARGLNYLHEDSRLRIIHRDLKPSNVLLDEEMVAKISDFGMARIFCEDQDTANTRRVVGTYGYMAPEYAMEGLFSVKSDVFSFGVILLEIISGKRNSDFYVTRLAQTLLAHTWNLWNEGKIMELVHPPLMESCSLTAEVLQCIHIGLLCVQENPADRPTMSFVIALLGSESIALPQPKQPAFSVSRIIPTDKLSATDASTNFITVSSISPR